MANVRTFARGVIKPLVSVVALVLATGAMAMTLAIQHDPRAFTRPKMLPEIVEPERLVRSVEIPLVEMTMFATMPVDTVIRLDEVLVEGRHLAALGRAKPVMRENSDHVIKPPCRDGEYRMLDPHRGVRLMCPGGSL